MPLYHRLVGLFLALLFLLFAGFQYNDPDPQIWIPVYLIAAVISLLVFFERIFLTAILFLMVLYIAGAIYLWPTSFEGLTLEHGYTSNIEEARESLGLAMCALSMIYYWYLSKKFMR